MDEKKLNEYRSAILEHILDTKDRFNEMNLFERFECAQEVMHLTKAYCCELFSLDPKNVKTFFVHGSNMGGIAGGRISELGFAAMALTTKKVMGATSIYDFYRTALHEFKHLDQVNNMTAENKETISHYDAKAEFNRFRWASSPSEGSADRFAFHQLLGLQRAILKQTDHKVSACKEYIDWCDRSLTSRVEHVGAEMLYGVLKPFLSGKVFRHIGDKSTTPKDPNDPTKILSFHEIRNMADMYPEYFRVGAFRPKNEAKIEEVKSAIDGYIEIKEWMDGGMKGMPGEKTFTAQGFDAMGEVKGEGVTLNLQQVLNLEENATQNTETQEESSTEQNSTDLTENTQTSTNEGYGESALPQTVQPNNQSSTEIIKPEIKVQPEIPSLGLDK